MLSDTSSDILNIIVYNEYAEPLENMRVELYASLDDWKSRTNHIAEIKMTDCKGQVNFKNLKAEKYFWYVEGGCRKNSKNDVSTQYPLIAGLRNRVKIYLRGKTVLQLINKSPDRYNILIDS